MIGRTNMHLPDDRSTTPGAPFTLLKPKLYKEVYEVGNIDTGDGARVGIYDGNVLYMAHCNGTEITMGVTIEHFLEMIGEYNKETGS